MRTTFCQRLHPAPIFTSRLIRFSLLFAFCFPLAPAGLAAPRINQAAKVLAGKLAVGPMDASVAPAHLAEVEKRLIPVLDLLQQSSRGNGPPPRDLLSQAFALRDDVSTDYAHLAASVILEAWEAARWLGLFDDQDRFDGTIRKGADVGQKAVFQYIVPAQYVPEFSRSFCNIEIVEPGKRRQSDDASKLSRRVIEFGNQLRANAKRDSFVKAPAGRQPAAGPTPGGPSDTGQDHDARWAKFRAADPDSARRVPSVVVRIQKMASPAKKSGGKYIFRLSVESRSSFPSEVNLKYFVVGKPRKNPKKPDAPLPDYCYMLEKSTTLKLLPGETVEISEACAPGKADYRGYFAVVKFGGNTITTASSDARMESLAGER
jgi:hypothetical protein